MIRYQEGFFQASDAKVQDHAKKPRLWPGLILMVEFYELARTHFERES